MPFKNVAFIIIKIEKYINKAVQNSNRIIQRKYFKKFMQSSGTVILKIIK